MEGRERAWARWLDQAIAMVPCSTRMHRQSLFSLYLLTESKKTWSWSDLRLKPRIFIEWNHKWLLCTIGPAINKKKPLQLTSPQSTLLLIISSLPTWHVNDKTCVFACTSKVQLGPSIQLRSMAEPGRIIQLCW